MGHFYGSQLLLLLLWATLLLTVGENIIWLEPPPVETVTDPSSISRINKQVIQGSLNEELSCNFSLTEDSSIISVLMKFRRQPVVTFVPNVLLQVEPVFAEHFNAVWVPNKLTLILFNVTDAEEGEYCCEVVTIGRSARSWIRKIQLLVLDPSRAIVPSITVPQNPIQTTASAIRALEDPRQTMVSSITGSQNPRQTMVSSITGSESRTWTTKSSSTEVDNQGVIIICVIVLIGHLCILFATLGFLKRGKSSKKQEVHHIAEEGKGSEESCDSRKKVW